MRILRALLLFQFQSGVGWLSGPLTVKTDKGTSLEADIIVKCIGNKINSEAYKSCLSEQTDEKDQLKVNEYFQVEGLENVFAIGDCCNSKELKEAYVAGLHAGKCPIRTSYMQRVTI